MYVICMHDNISTSNNIFVEIFLQGLKAGEIFVKPNFFYNYPARD